MKPVSLEQKKEEVSLLVVGGGGHKFSLKMILQLFVF